MSGVKAAEAGTTKLPSSASQTAKAPKSCQAPQPVQNNLNTALTLAKLFIQKRYFITA